MLGRATPGLWRCVGLLGDLLVRPPLPTASGRASFWSMRRLATQFLLLLGALAFLAGAPVAYAVTPPALAGEPCPHEHKHMPGPTPQKHQHPHDHGAAACLCCCLGACMGIPGLPPPQMAAAVFMTSTIVYWESGTRRAGRSIPPDPAPPRPGA
jgi:hypothetical protein